MCGLITSPSTPVVVAGGGFSADNPAAGATEGTTGRRKVRVVIDRCTAGVRR